MLQFCTLPTSRGFHPRRAVPAAHIRSCGGPRLRTLGSSYLALLLQGQGGGGASSGRTDGSTFVNLLASATPVSAAVLAVLTLLSVACWSIIFYKLWVFRRSRRHSLNFLDVFRRSNKFSEVQAVCRSLGESPLVGLFQAGYAELTAQLRQTSPPDVANGPNPHAPVPRP